MACVTEVVRDYYGNPVQYTVQRIDRSTRHCALHECEAVELDGEGRAARRFRRERVRLKYAQPHAQPPPPPPTPASVSPMVVSPMAVSPVQEQLANLDLTPAPPAPPEAPPAPPSKPPCPPWNDLLDSPSNSPPASPSDKEPLRLKWRVADTPIKGQWDHHACNVMASMGESQDLQLTYNFPHLYASFQHKLYICNVDAKILLLMAEMQQADCNSHPPQATNLVCHHDITNTVICSYKHQYKLQLGFPNDTQVVLRIENDAEPAFWTEVTLEVANIDLYPLRPADTVYLHPSLGVTLQPFGVLGSALTPTGIEQRSTPHAGDDGGCAIVDPAGLHFIQNGPQGAGGAAGQIYRWLQLGSQFPPSVRDQITRAGEAKFNMYYGNHHSAVMEVLPIHKPIIHVVGPNFQHTPDIHQQDALAQLKEAYTNIFKEAAANATSYAISITRLRLLPVSGGIFAGPGAVEATPRAMRTHLSKPYRMRAHWAY